jgi:hypothetical protein
MKFWDTMPHSYKGNNLQANNTFFDSNTTTYRYQNTKNHNVVWTKKAGIGTNTGQANFKYFRVMLGFFSDLSSSIQVWTENTFGPGVQNARWLCNEALPFLEETAGEVESMPKIPIP